MSKSKKTKAELAKSGDATVTTIFIITGIVFCLIWWPLGIATIIGYIFYKRAALRDIKSFEETGEVYLGGEDVKLISLEATYPESIPFAVVMDVETTGLLVDDTAPTIKKVKENPDWYPNIVQMAWVTMDRDYRPVQVHAYYVKQKTKIPERAIEIHGITDEVCEKEGIELMDLLNTFSESIAQCDYYAGHSVQFDKYVIEAESIKSILPKPFKHMKMYDTMKMGTTVTGKYKSTLMNLAERVLGKEVLAEAKLNFHDAKSDVTITASLFKALHSRGIKY